MHAVPLPHFLLLNSPALPSTSASSSQLKRPAVLALAAAPPRPIPYYDGWLPHPKAVRAATFSPNGRLIATACDDCTARVYDARNGKLLRTFEGHGDWIRAVVFSPDGSLVLTACDDNVARVYNVATGALLHELRGHANSVYACARSPDGKAAITAGGDGDALIWDVAHGAEIRRIVGAEVGAPPVPLLCCDWSPAEAAVVLPRGPTALAEWNPETGALVREFEASGLVVACAYSRGGGGKVAAAVRGGPARAIVWSAVTGARLYRLGALSASAFQHPLAFSPDSRFLITAVGDGSNDLRLWNAETGTIRRDLGCFGHSSEVASCHVSPDGRALLSVSLRGKVRLSVDYSLMQVR